MKLLDLMRAQLTKLTKNKSKLNALRSITIVFKLFMNKQTSTYELSRARTQQALGHSITNLNERRFPFTVSFGRRTRATLESR